MTSSEMMLLKGTYLAPYIQLATLLIGKNRTGGGNMFRHQIDTMGTLIDYGYIESVLLKASLVHDVIEDIPDFNHNQLLSIDFESPAVYDLVLQVTRNPGETKPEFLSRIRESGSKNAKILKCADRISNMIALGFVTSIDFIARYTDETLQFILPIAEEVDKNMLRELESLITSRRNYLSLIQSV